MASARHGAGAWYLPAEECWVAPAEAGKYPHRQGDLFGPVEIAGERWDAALLVHPTCEAAKATVRELQVVRVRPLAAVADASQRAQVVAGFVERDRAVRVAFAHTFFLAPIPATDEPLFANFREIALCGKDRLLSAGRLAAMTHDARVTLIRRKLYFRYRLNVSFEQVRELEAQRIAGDPRFAGPRPAWGEIAA